MEARPSSTPLVATLLTLLAAAGVGCAPTRSVGPIEPTYQAPPTPFPAETPLDGAGPDALVALALAHNPTLGAASARVARVQERVAQATSLPDPTVSAMAGELAETAAGRVELRMTATQPIPFPTKLGARGDVARREVERVEADLAVARLDVSAEVRRAYWQLYDVDRAVELTGESRVLLEQLKRVAESKLRVGRASQQDVLHASVELSRVDERLLLLADRRARTAAMLNRLLHRPAGSTVPTLPRAEARVAELDPRAVLERAMVASPDLERARTDVARAHQELELAQLERWPDFSVNGSYGLVDDSGLSAVANGDDQWGVGVGITLPIWFGRLSAGEEEARQAVREGTGRVAAARDEVAYRVQEALGRIEARRSLLALFDERIVPQAEQAFEVSIPAYTSGKLDFLSLIDHWRRLLDVELQQQRALAELEQGLADLARAVGVDVETLLGTSPELTGRTS